MKPILDACCGSRMFWFDRENPNVIFADNCRWATMQEQSINKRNTIRVEYKGEILALSEVAGLLGVKYGFLYVRIKKGMSVNDVIHEINSPN